MNIFVVLIKMVLATIVGGIIGLERTKAGKQAGIKTHALLCLATCALTLLALSLSEEETPRVIAGIIQGIGFLTAGVIFFEKSQEFVKGLTSSAILWLVGIIGIICATKYWYYLIPLGICYVLIVNVMGSYENYFKTKLNENNIEETPLQEPVKKKTKKTTKQNKKQR